MFGLLFFRLWSLQVLSGDRYLQAAQDNQLRTFRVEAPRGVILDRNGRTVVSNVPGTAVQIWVERPPEGGPLQHARGALARAARAPPPARARGGSCGDGPADADHRQDRRQRAGDRVSLRAPDRVPGRPHRADVPARLRVPRRGGPPARLRRRDLAGGAEGEALGPDPLPRRGQDREGRRRGRVRRLPARPRRHGADPGRLARPPARAAGAARRGEGRRRDPAHARHRPAAGRGARAPRGDRDREGERGVQRGGRRHRGARPAGRRHPSDGLEPDVQAVDLRWQARSGQAALAARPGRGGARELPRPQPRLGGPVSARLDVQAGRGARSDAGRTCSRRASPSPARRPSATASTSSSSRTGTRTSAAR